MTGTTKTLVEEILTSQVIAVVVVRQSDNFQIDRLFYSEDNKDVNPLVFNNF